MKCTYCGGEQFYSVGAGASVNVLCANVDCRHWFNYTMDRMDDLERVEPTKEEKREIANQEALALSGYKGNQVFKGALHYASEKPLRELFDGEKTHEVNFLRLAGWLDELRKEMKDGKFSYHMLDGRK